MTNTTISPMTDADRTAVHDLLRSQKLPLDGFDEPHVVALRQFRDRYLERTELGRAFIRLYYRHSPPVAAVIAEHEWLRFMVRMLLAPLVLTIAFPLRALALAGLVALMLSARRILAGVV